MTETTPAAGPDQRGEWHGAALDLEGQLSYGDYLALDTILDAQRPLSGDRNELLFIIQHQTSELWMKLALQELHDAMAQLRTDDPGPALKMLARTTRIFQQLVAAWDVLSTMTPSEYSAIRPSLGLSSGFQSFQYREIEFVLGNRNPAMLRPHASHPHRQAPLERALRAPSLYDEVIRLLARQGLDIAASRLQLVSDGPTQHDASVEAAWRSVYGDPDQHWLLYELGEKLVDIEDLLRQWRFRHLTTVERVIGFKRGTGGTEGVAYLRRMLDVVMFPELWRLRTSL